MVRIFTILLILVSCHLFAQQVERTVAGRLTGSDGSPLPGVSIRIKGTSIGTTTDVDGNYSLKAPIGSTLLFSFVGMKPREVLVTKDNLSPVRATSSSPRKRDKKRRTPASHWPQSFFQDGENENQEGVTYLTNETPTYINKDPIAPESVVGIRPVTRIRKVLATGQKASSGGYLIKTNDMPLRTGFGLQFSSAIGIETVTRLPKLQHDYAQGRAMNGALTWQGPEVNETFSWGPLMRTLEFDGSQYDFDRHGKLVSAGNGTGTPAKTYDATSFFKTGYTTYNDVLLTLPGPKLSTLIFEGSRKYRSGVIPQAGYTRYNASLQLKNFKLHEHLAGDAQVSFHSSDGDLLSRGANLATITGAVYSTPSSFDNSNGLPRRQAAASASSYQREDGSVRSFSPGLADNPYGLINNMPDNEQWKRFLSMLTLRYGPRAGFGLNLSGNFDKQWNDIVHGLYPGLSGYTAGRYTRREETLTSLNTIISPSWTFYAGDAEMKASLSYQFNYNEQSVARLDGFGFTSDTFDHFTAYDSSVMSGKTLSRTIHEILMSLQYKRYWVNARLANRLYFSNTVRADDYTNSFPTASVSINLEELVSVWPINFFRVHSSVSRSLRESSLVYASTSHLSTRMPVEQYNRFFESRELYLSSGILPETEWKFETGFKIWLDRIQFEAAYFNNVTHDFIAPGWNAGQFMLSNAAQVKNYGTTLSASYNNYNREIDWGINLRWSSSNSKTLKLYGTQPWVPLAGFESSAAVLAAGKPVGALYGTTFLRNEQGNTIVGEDGFPLVDPSLKMIGSPIPDWTMGLESFMQWKGFRVSLLFDIKHGGDVWNGTQAMLDYLGRSETTARQRNISGFVFDGVTTSGTPNTVAVDFYDPTNTLDKNRWVRYGAGGVGEEHIEDASWFRLSEVTISYTTKIPGSRIKELKFSLVGRNLFLVTPYTGVDPSSTLFGYSTGTGLDLFNAPGTRSFSAQVTLKI